MSELTVLEVIGSQEDGPDRITNLEAGGATLVSSPKWRVGNFHCLSWKKISQNKVEKLFIHSPNISGTPIMCIILF